MASMEKPIFDLLASCACASGPLRTTTRMADKTVSLRNTGSNIFSLPPYFVLSIGPIVCLASQMRQHGERKQYDSGGALSNQRTSARKGMRVLSKGSTLIGQLLVEDR